MNHLTLENLTKLLKTNYEDDKALILTENLKSSLIIVRGDIYEITDNIIYVKLFGNIDDKIVTFISKYLSDSTKDIWKKNPEGLNELKDNVKKSLDYIFKNSFIKSILPQLKKYLTNNDIIFNTYTHQIHFQNGFMDLKDNTFKKRVLGTNYISKFISRDYKPSTIEQRKYVKKEYLNKIYSNKQDQDIILNIIGTAFAGLAQKEQKMTFLLGKGSTGKSTIINFSEKSFGCYFKELDDNTFKEGNSKKDKIINTYLSDPQILLTVINEMKTTRIDKSLYKKFCDGKLQTTKLFLDDSFTVNHNSSLICLANEIPQGELFDDTGSKRRCVAYKHKNEFIDRTDEHLLHLIDNKKVFLMNKNLIDEFHEKNLENAWCDIIFKRSYGLINDKISIVYSDSFKEMKNMLVNSKNYIEDFVKLYLYIEPNNTDLRIHKDDMLEKYKEETNDLKMTTESLLPKLNFDYNIKYDLSKLRCNGKKGVWIGCRFRTPAEVKEIQNIDGGFDVEVKGNKTHDELFTLTDNIEINKIKTKNEELQKENEKLKKSLFELNLLLKEKEKEYDTEDTEDEIIIDEDVEVEPPTESYSRDYDKDEEMENIFNQLF